MQVNDAQIKEFIRIRDELSIMELITEHVANDWLWEEQECHMYCKYCLKLQPSNAVVSTGGTHEQDCIHLKAKELLGEGYGSQDK